MAAAFKETHLEKVVRNVRRGPYADTAEAVGVMVSIYRAAKETASQERSLKKIEQAVGCLLRVKLGLLAMTEDTVFEEEVNECLPEDCADDDCFTVDPDNFRMDLSKVDPRMRVKIILDHSDVALESKKGLEALKAAEIEDHDDSCFLMQLCVTRIEDDSTEDDYTEDDD